MPCQRSGVITWGTRSIQTNHGDCAQIATGKTAASSCSPIRPIRTVLIANRGEIALRIMRTARRLGIRSVAVYSDADRDAVHVQQADDAIRLGESPATSSYLNVSRVLAAAAQCQADALHPGYGFLSESYDFAEKCEHSGVTFIGPPAAAIRAMGVKSTSKRLMQEAGVPVVPGYHGNDQSEARLYEEARQIGFPVMIKATHGGGGKGMRVAVTESVFYDQLQSARLEAQQAFGCDDVLIEKLVQKPRHVEVQVFGDRYGACVHLFERDCSLQRRHQKVIEEAPAPGIDEQLRQKLGEAAVRAAQAVNYVGAGTVEFIFDPDTRKFYFMEMNTRLQVEHPITEMISGVDLVEWQFRMANGESLPVRQDQLRLNGHSFEARVYAEDPDQEFMPSPGLIHRLQTPNPSEHVRVELGTRAGDQVPIFYDPMIAKLAVWAPDRSSALNRLRRELSEFVVVGPKTNIDFLLRLADQPEVRSAEMYTDYIRDHSDRLLNKNVQLTNKQLLKFAIAYYLSNKSESNERMQSIDYRSFNAYRPRYEFTLKDESSDRSYQFRIRSMANNQFEIEIDSDKRLHNVSITRLNSNDVRNWLISFGENESQSRFGFAYESNALHLYDGERVLNLKAQLPTYLKSETADVEFDDRIVAPMPGVIQKLLFEQGDCVKKGDAMLVMIAMKMEHVIKAGRDCTIKRIRHEIGQSVAKGEVILELEEN